MKRRVLIVPLLVAFVLLVVAGVIRRLDSPEAVEERVEGVVVVIGAVERRNIEEILRYPGTLTPRQTVTVVPKVAGRVETIHVSEGERVAPGRLLISLDSQSIELQADQAYSAWQAALAQYRKAERGVREGELENARASYAQARDDLEAARRDLERSKRLYEAGTIARAKYEEAEAAFRSASTAVENAKRSLEMMEEGATSEELDSAKANAEALKARYDLAELQIAETRITASSYGTVASIMVDAGNMVAQGTPLIAIVGEDPIYAQVAIPEKYYGRFVDAKRRIAARVYPTAYGTERPYAGFVERVSPLIDPQSRTFTVEIALPNPSGRLKPGMYVNTDIIIDIRENALVVPESAVVRRDDRDVLFAVREGASAHATMIEIDPGLRSGGYVEIRSGLVGDEPIIVEGNAFLEDGQPVRVVTVE